MHFIDVFALFHNNKKTYTVKSQVLYDVILPRWLWGYRDFGRS